MVLPMRLVWEVQLPKRQKVALGGVFALGTLIVIFAAIRMKKTIDGIKVQSAATNVLLSLWTITECFVGMFCHHTFRPPLKLMFVGSGRCLLPARFEGFNLTQKELFL
jgi:hypothetical protein